MSDIFISYRRDDSAGETRSIRDRLGGVFSSRRVFMDVDAIPAGVDFREYLVSSIRKCRVALVVIGPHWLDSKTADGRRRLDDPQDYVRIEIELALAREGNQEICVIPVLLNGATMPPPLELCESLRPITFRNAIDVRHGSFNRDVAELIRNVSRYVPAARKAKRGPASPRTLAIAAAACVALLGGVAWVLWSVLAGNSEVQAQQAAVRVIEKLKAGDLAGAAGLAEEYIDRNPQWADTQSFKDVRASLAAEREKASRHERYAALHARLAAKAPFEIQEGELRELQDLAQTATEQKQCELLQNARETAISKRRREYNAQQSKELASLEAEVERARSVEIDSNDVKKIFTGVQARLNGLRGDKQLDAQTHAAAEKFSQTVAALVAPSPIPPWTAEQAKPLTAAVGDPHAYSKSLASFISDHPLSAAAADFRRLRDEVPLWEAVEGWSKVFQEPSWSSVALLAGGSRRLNQQLIEAESRLGPHPLGDEYRQLRGHLEKVGSRIVDSTPIHTQFKDRLLRDRLLQSLWMVELESGQRYYGLGSLPAKGATAINAQIDRDLKATRSIPLTASQDAYRDVAPHCILVKRICDELAEARAKDLLQDKWEKTFCTLLYSVRRQRNLDPILAVQLYEPLLRVAVQGSYPMSCAFAEDLATLSSIKVDTSVNWLDPLDKEASRARTKAVEVLRGLGDVMAQSRRALDIAAHLAAIEAPRFASLGWLRRADPANWQIAAEKIPESGVLYIVIPGGATASEPTGNLVPLARLERGQPQWEKDARVFIEGRPVYLRRDHYKATSCATIEPK